MSILRQILRFYSQGEKKLKISTLSGVSRNTLKKYLRIYHGLGLSINEIEALSDKSLDELFGENLKREHLWSRYITANPDGYRITQFKHHYRQWLKSSKPVMHIEHTAGDKMYIDFAGEKLQFVNLETGEIADAVVFISVLGASQLAYIEAV